MIKDSSESVRTEALSALEKTLYDHHLQFSEPLWREILSLVILPALEGIKKEAETSLRAGNQANSDYFTGTLQKLL